MEVCMARKHVIAYFMHETERENARQVMPGAEVTDSYVIGDVDDAQIPQLQHAGLIMAEVETVPGLKEAETFEAMHGQAKTKLRSARGVVPGAAMGIAAAAVPPTASFYLIQLRGPLLESWRTRLQQLGVELLERFPNRFYKARLTTQQVQSLSNEQSIVQEIRQFDP